MSKWVGCTLAHIRKFSKLSVFIILHSNCTHDSCKIIVNVERKMVGTKKLNLQLPFENTSFRMPFSVTCMFYLPNIKFFSFLRALFSRLYLFYFRMKRHSSFSSLVQRYFWQSVFSSYSSTFTSLLKYFLKIIILYW